MAGFLTRVANNVIYVLDDSQFAQLRILATSQISQIDEYGYRRFPLMSAFRRLLDGDIPRGSAGLNLNAVKKASLDDLRALKADCARLGAAAVAAYKARGQYLQAAAEAP